MRITIYKSYNDYIKVHKDFPDRVTKDNIKQTCYSMNIKWYTNKLYRQGDDRI